MEKTVSVITVNYNGKRYLKGFFESLLGVGDKDRIADIIMVDNLSEDDSVASVAMQYPEVKIIRNQINNYVKAVNIGIENARGDYIVLLNNDTVVDPEWLTGLIRIIESDERIGAVQSKILFADRKVINSVGGEEIEDFYFRDIGFGEKDIGQYEEAKEIQYFSGGSVMLRRECLQDTGGFDEDYIMFFEDIDYSIRARKKGWKLFYSPFSTLYHKYHGSASSELCDYLCTRNRFLCLAAHYPERLPASIRTSHFYTANQYEFLYRALLYSMKKLAGNNDAERVANVLHDIKAELASIFGYTRAVNFFSQTEILLGLRKIRIGIYDHAFHFAGGGQRYAAELAQILQERCDITYIVNKDISLDIYMEWFNIDLSNCKLKVMKIPFFEKRDGIFIDEGMVLNEENNPFDIISEESLRYDVFINANMLSKVNPLSAVSVFICHFPDGEPARFFKVDNYDYLVSSGMYGSSWIKKRWGLVPTHLMYPPVDMYNGNSSPERKKNIILSVARFELGGSKKQVELVRAFTDLARKREDIRHQWKLILAGGNFPNNPYYKTVEKEVRYVQCDIELRTDLRYEEIKELYAEASIFWHACGIDETNPHLVEHFGMTTVEAMQNYCVPVVIDGGGQVEIVDHAVNGFRFKSIEELQHYTLKVIDDPALRKSMGQKAYEKSAKFNHDTFVRQVEELFEQIEFDLRGVDVL